MRRIALLSILLLSPSCQSSAFVRVEQGPVSAGFTLENSR
jgi:hypothetical protein